MFETLFHVWRNSPSGRELLLQSINFCRQLEGMSLHVYQPLHKQALMYFEGAVVTLELDGSYLAHLETSDKHLQKLLDESGVHWERVKPSHYTASTLPDLPTDFSMMTCPRAISENTSRIGLAHIGPVVRTLVKNASFPIFIPAMCVRPWHRVAAFFGGSELGQRAVRFALDVASRAKMPLTVYTQLDGLDESQCRAKLTDLGVNIEDPNANPGWVRFTTGTLEENLYDVPTDALVVTGAAGEKLMQALLFGSKLETIQATLPNPLLVVGPKKSPRASAV